MKRIIYLFTALMMAGCNHIAEAQSYREKLTKTLYAIENEEMSKAQGYLDDILDETPTNADALYLRAKIHYYHNDNNALAIIDCTKALKYHKKSNVFSMVEIYSMRGRVYEYIKEYDLALADYDRALKLDKENVEILERRAELYFTMMDYSASDNDFKTILKIEPHSRYAMVGVARNLINQENYEPAFEILNKAVKLDPEYAMPYKFLCRAYYETGDYRKAVDNVILQLTYDEDWFALEYLRKLVKEVPDYTILKLTEAYSNNSDNLMWLFTRGVSYGEIGNYIKAIDDYTTLISYVGEDDTLAARIGYCYSEMEDHVSAAEYYSQAITIDPNEGEYYLLRAESKRKTGDLDSAIEDYTKSIELNPMNAFAYGHRGWSKEMQGDYAGSVDDQNKAIALDEEFGYYYLFRARAYQLLGREVEAAADFATIIRIDTIPDSNSCRAYALIELGLENEAIEWGKRVIEQEKYAGNYYDMACIYARVGRDDDALNALREALEKGYRSFGHIAQDDDVDSIRHLPEFQALIAEYESKYIDSNDDEVIPRGEEAEMTSEIQMMQRGSGVYEVPCTINDLPLTFIFDTGASTVTISSLEASFMLKNNYLNKSDILSREYYLTASGTIEEGTRIRLKSVRIGDFSLDNIEATVMDNQKAPLLLGQSVLSRFGKVDIDYQNMKIILKQ